MSIIRFLARPLLASSFIADGIVKVKSASDETAPISPLTRRAVRSLPVEISDATAARAIGVVQVAAGGLFALGKFPRLAALVLSASAIGQTVIDAREPVGAHEKGWRRGRLFKNLAIVGGTLIAAVDRNGKPSLAWRIQDQKNTNSKED